MIELKDLMPISFLKKEAFTGSFKGMRYRLKKAEISSEDDPEKKTTLLEGCIWPQPFCFDKTPEDQKRFYHFDFNDAGLKQALDWLNTSYTDEKKRWTRE